MPYLFFRNFPKFRREDNYIKLSRISGETDRDEPDHLHQLDAGIRGHVRVYRAYQVAGPGWMLHDVQRVLSNGRRVRRVRRTGNEKQVVGRYTAKTRWQTSGSSGGGGCRGSSPSDHRVPVNPAF